jgi:hypothetical protein
MPNPQKPPFVPTSDQVTEVFRNSLMYEIMYTFGVPENHDPDDYYQWESVNFARMTHARLLYDFFQTSKATREAKHQRHPDGSDDVIAEDFGFGPERIPPIDGDRKRVNKDLLHLTYARLRHTAKTKPWPDSYLGCLLAPTVRFMRHINNTLSALFTGPKDRKLWDDVLTILESGKELRVQCVAIAGKMVYQPRGGDPLPGGLPRLTQPVRIPPRTNYGGVINTTSAIIDGLGQ